MTTPLRLLALVSDPLIGDGQPVQRLSLEREVGD